MIPICGAEIALPPIASRISCISDTNEAISIEVGSLTGNTASFSSTSDFDAFDVSFSGTLPTNNGASITSTFTVGIQTSGMLGTSGTLYGGLKLDSVNNTPITIELSESSSRGTHGFREMNIGASDFDTNTPQISSSSGSSLAGLTISSIQGAFAALATIDQALEHVGKEQAKLGAIQNRLGYTASAMNAVSVSVKNAKASILDADYASESTKLAAASIQ